MTTAAEASAPRIRDIQPRLSAAGDPSLNPLIYVPVVGYLLETRATHSVIQDQIKKIVADEKADKISHIRRTPQLLHHLDLRNRFFEAGQTRSFLSVALAIGCVIAFPQLILVKVFAATLITCSALGYLGYTGMIQEQNSLIADLKNKDTFGDEVLKRLNIK